MEMTDFLARLEDHLATRLGALDADAHPSSDGPRRLTRQWTLEFLAQEATAQPGFENLAALLRNVTATQG